MTSFEGFSDSLKDFLPRVNSVKKTVDWLLKHKNDFGFSEITCMLSIGSATGDIECEIIKAMPKLEILYAIEPDLESCSKLQQKVQMVKNMVYPQKLESVERLPREVDFILMSHVAYYFSNCFEEQILKVQNWLKLNGSLLILVGQDDNTFTRVAKKFGDPVYQFLAGSIRDRLNKMKIPFVELAETIPFEIDICNIDHRFAKFAVNRDASPEECEEIIKFIDMDTKGCGKIHDFQVMFRITKN